MFLFGDSLNHGDGTVSSDEEKRVALIVVDIAILILLLLALWIGTRTPGNPDAETWSKESVSATQ